MKKSTSLVSAFILGFLLANSLQCLGWFTFLRPAIQRCALTATMVAESTRVSNNTDLVKQKDPVRQNWTGELSRSWDYWPYQERPLPCYPFKRELFRDQLHANATQGLLFVKPEKVGGSTAAGVHLRVMHRLAKRQTAFNSRFCSGFFQHGPGTRFGLRNRAESFLWSLVRDPTQRAVSEFFHYHVSREKVEPNDENMRGHMRGFRPNYYHRLLPVRPRTKQTMKQLTEQIIQDYDFIGVTERFEESVVVLQLLTGLSTADIVYLNAKRNGGFDGGHYHQQCFYIFPSYISPGMTSFLRGPLWQAKVQHDNRLYQAVNRSLDRTIQQTIGVQTFERALKRFRHAQHTVEENCLDTAIFPCSPGGVRRSPAKTNCYWMDSGCGYPCMDEVSEQLDI